MMKYIAKSQAIKIENSPACTVFEYGGDSNIDGAVAIINGRYPEQHFVVNERSKEILYVISGTGKLVTKEQEKELGPGDMALVPDGEAYYFEGNNLKIFMANTPPFDPVGHKEVE